MKKIIAILVILTLMLSGCSKDTDTVQDTVETAESLEALCTQVGVEINVPSTARYQEYFVVNSVVARVNYSFNTVFFTHNASKVLSGTGLSGISDKIQYENSITLDNRAELKFYTYENGMREAVWTKNGVNHSICTEKNVTDDLLTELCDLVIK